MQDITDLVSDLDYECQDNRNFHNTMRNKFDKIDSNSAEIGELKDLLENLRLQVDNLKNTQESSFIQNALDKIYPVGSIYVSFEEKNPSTFLGGNWTQISGRFLLGVDNAHRVGTTGGEEFHKLTTEEMPAHTHSSVADSKGAHTHTRGTMNITGQIPASVEHYRGSTKGCFYDIGGLSTVEGHSYAVNGVGFDASRNWTGATSECPNHTHTITVANTGSSQAHNNMPPYTAVYMYRRIS